MYEYVSRKVSKTKIRAMKREWGDDADLVSAILWRLKSEVGKRNDCLADDQMDQQHSGTLGAALCL